MRTKSHVSRVDAPPASYDGGVDDPKRALDQTIAAPSTGLAPPSSTIDSARRVAGRYEILGLLGAGGMGTVYKARDVELDEIVALKVLRRDLVDAPGMLERFRREVKLARRVTHKNVARAHDIGEHDGDKFITMEFIDGEALSRVLARTSRVPTRRAVELGLALCDALGAAHEAGVVHRDLKPDNVMIATDGRIVVTDFGIARAVEPGAAARTQGVPVGTPAYMAPEQVEGASDVDARADIYALGIMLYELFAGELPFAGDSAYAVAAARLVTPPPDPRARGVPDAAASLILRCLARKPAGRFGDAREVAAALREVPIDDARDALQENPTYSSSGTRGVLTPTTASALARTSVAVLPFANRGAADDDYLADGITEDLIDLLTMTSGLRVRPRGAVMRWKGKPIDVREIGAALEVDVVVEGSVRKAGDLLRVSARVSSVADGFQLWAKRFDRPASDVLAVSDEVAQAVAHALTVEAPSADRRAPTNPIALDLCLRARHAYHSFDSVMVLRSVELFEEARRLAPDDPMVLTGCALARSRMWFFGGEGAGELAREAADRAVLVAPDRGEAHVARAAVRFQSGDVPGAVRDVRHALALAPALADAHELLGRILCETGPAEEGIHHMNLAAQLDPGFADVATGTARVHALLGEWEEAWRVVDQIVERVDLVNGWITVARLVSWSNDVERARAYLAHPSVAGGKAPAARAILEKVVSPESVLSARRLFTGAATSAAASWRTRALLHQAETEVAAGAGELELAFDRLAQAVDVGLIDLLWVDSCPTLGRLRADARFAPLRARVAERAEEVRRVLAEHRVGKR